MCGDEEVEGKNDRNVGEMNKMIKMNKNLPGD